MQRRQQIISLTSQLPMGCWIGRQFLVQWGFCPTQDRSMEEQHVLPRFFPDGTALQNNKIGATRRKHSSAMHEQKEMDKELPYFHMLTVCPQLQSKEEKGENYHKL